MAGHDYLGIPREKIHWNPVVNVEKCIGCGVCLEICPNNVYAMNRLAGKAEVNHPENCVVLCDKCAGFCSQDAISFPDKAEAKQLVGNLLQQKGKQDDQTQH